MDIYLDENLPPTLAQALDLLNQFDDDNIRVHSLISRFGRGVADEDWIPILGAENAIVITQDYNIQQTRHQYALYRQHGLGVFFLRSPGKRHSYTYWEIVRELIKKWHSIKENCNEDRMPFAFRITQRRLEELN